MAGSPPIGPVLVTGPVRRPAGTAASPPIGPASAEVARPARAPIVRLVPTVRAPTVRGQLVTARVATAPVAIARSAVRVPMPVVAHLAGQLERATGSLVAIAMLPSASR